MPNFKESLPDWYKNSLRRSERKNKEATPEWRKELEQNKSNDN